MKWNKVSLQICLKRLLLLIFYFSGIIYYFGINFNFRYNPNIEPEGQGYIPFSHILDYVYFYIPYIFKVRFCFKFAQEGWYD